MVLVCQGVVDGHAYTVLSVMGQVAGTEFDMIRVVGPGQSTAREFYTARSKQQELLLMFCYQ